MRVYWLILLCSFTILSCQEGKIEAPETVLHDTVMIDMIIDAFVLNAAYAETFGAVRDSISEAFSQQLFQQHNIPENVFLENLEWLQLHPEKLDKIYDKVLEKLDTLEDEAHSKRYKTQN